MSIRVSNGSTIMGLVSPYLPIQNCTICMWVRRVADGGCGGGNTDTLIQQVDSTYAYYNNFYIDSAYVFNAGRNGAYSSVSGSVADFTWMFCALAIGTTYIQVYYGQRFDGYTLHSNPINDITYSNFTPYAVYFGNVSPYELEAHLSSVKIWDAVLTKQELEKERFSYLPARKINLHSCSPFLSADRAVSIMGKYTGNIWTLNNVPWTGYDNPPIPYGTVTAKSRNRSRVFNSLGNLIDQEGFRFRNDDGPE